LAGVVFQPVKKKEVMKMPKAEYKIIELPINAVKPSKDNPRKEFDADQLNILKKSIEKHEIIEPILVRKQTREIIDGERRWRAEKSAGRKHVAVRIFDVDEHEAKEIRLTAQLQRVALNEREKEDAIFDLWKSGRYASKGELAHAIGESDGTVEELTQAKQERIDAEALAREPVPEMKAASARDLRETRQLGKIDPEARAELLKQRVNKDNGLTQDEMIQVAKTAVTIPTPESRKKFIEERKILKEEAKADLKEHDRRRELEATGVEGVTVTRSTQDFAEHSSEARLLQAYMDLYGKAFSTLHIRSIKAMKDTTKQAQCVNWCYKTYKLCENILKEMDVL
jgi:ParB family chromosome partitioning protein